MTYEPAKRKLKPASPEFIRFAEEVSKYARARAAGCPVGSLHPIPWKRNEGILERMLRKFL